MLKQGVLLLVLLVAATTWAHGANGNWIEVRSPHFVVLTDSNEREGRHIADQFERVRSVFHVLFPKANVDPSSPIIVIAVKDKKGFQALEPEAYLGKGQVNLAGFFLRALDKNYVLLRLDVQGEHPYATVYHEYTHLLMGKAGEWLPLWLNEGLAEFFANTEIHSKDAQLGQPSTDDILYLRQTPLMPLVTLLEVDANSPYYHEEKKGSVFYAESWALTHYLEMADREGHTHRLADYADLVNRNHDSVAAAQQVFGDLNRLQKTLETYVAQSRFRYFTLVTSTEVDDNAFMVRPLTPPQADAVRADFLAYNERAKDSRALLESVLRDDPTNVSAHETMGYLEFRAGNLEAARKWYGEAVKLDSQSFLAHYYFATISMRAGDSKQAEVEASLRTAIRLNPGFAAAYDQLAAFYGMHHEKLDEAHTLTLQAVQLDPGQLGYRLNAANVQMEAERYSDAVAVLENALSLAKTPEEVGLVQNRISEIQRYRAVREQMAQTNQMPERAGAEADSGQSASSTRGGDTRADADTSAPKYRSESPRGPKHVASGVLRNVHCSPPAVLELKVEGTGKGVSLYSNNYFKVAFSAVNYKAQGEIRPCNDLEGMKASVQYSETTNHSVDGQILAIELSK
jgi:tetratricopeptide (TPR) repeat protein